MLSRCWTWPRQRGASSPPAPHPTPPMGGDRALPSDYTRGAWGYNAAPRAGSCQLVITAKKDTHTRVHKHTRTSLLASALIGGAIA